MSTTAIERGDARPLPLAWLRTESLARLLLAQIAKNIGQTLRAFQPTIKELQQVSQEFKSALEQEVRARRQSQRVSYAPV